MFTNLEEWIGRSLDRTDEASLIAVYSDKKTSGKIEQLRRSRITYCVSRYVIGFLITSLIAIELLTSLFSGFSITDSHSYGMFRIVIVLIPAYLSYATKFSKIDAQIKMLLLFEQTQPKG